jgi:predicted branched-subunit amino acid permease
MTHNDIAALRQARSQAISVASAVSLYGLSFGALSVISGFSIAQTMVLSLVMFSGASQFAFVGVLASGGLTAGWAAVGDVMGDVRTWGLDAAAAAAFLALLWPRLNRREPIAVGLGAGVLTALLLPIFPAGVPIVVVAVVTIGVGLYRHRIAPERPPRAEVS